jgi:hypothetical protein
MRLGLFREADDDWSWAVRLLKRPTSYFHLADCRERLREPDKARQAYENGLALAGFDHPSDDAPEEIKTAFRRLSALK